MKYGRIIVDQKKVPICDGAFSSRDLKQAETSSAIDFTNEYSMPTSANMGSKLNLDGMMLFEQPFARVSGLNPNTFIRC